jgi:adenosine deaminase
VVRTANDLREIAYEYLNQVSAGGTKYVEFMISPMHSMENGIAFSSQISAISDALEQAKTESQISGCIIITCVRHRGPDEAMQIAEMAVGSKNHHIRGFGMTGNELLFDVSAFKRAFLIAGNSGLGLTAHAGEWLPAKTVLKAVKTLNLTRVGHGISIVEDKDVLAELVERNIGFEVCLSSNVQLGASKCYETHPARKMIDSGCRLTFTTDDAAYFRTTPKQEMRLAVQHFRLTENEQWKAFHDAVGMAFCSEETKAFILRQAEGP